MLHALICAFLTAPGTAAITVYDLITTHWLVVAAVAVLFVILLILTRFEILELIPILSVVIDWGELLFSEVGLVLVGYLVLSALITVQTIPVCSAALP
jgi:hypothetical protein